MKKSTIGYKIIAIMENGKMIGINVHETKRQKEVNELIEMRATIERQYRYFSNSWIGTKAIVLENEEEKEKFLKDFY
ncbi:MAG: hypothetical protein ACRDCW_06755 [Sarcina sp.]